MKTKTIKIPVTWTETGYYEYTVPEDMPEKQAIAEAISLAKEDELPKNGDYLTDSFCVDEEGIEITEGTETEEPDIKWEKRSISGIQFSVLLNRPLDEDEMISTGSYTFMDDEEHTFDFYDFEGYRRAGSRIDVVHRTLDIQSFPDATSISRKMLENGIFTDVYVDLEGCRDDVKVDRVFNMRIWFDDGTYLDIKDHQIKYSLTELSYLHCIQLIECCIESGKMQKDPHNSNNVLVYCKSKPGRSAGWYSINIMTEAQELHNDVFGQRYLLGMLEKEGITPEWKDPWWKEL